MTDHAQDPAPTGAALRGTGRAAVSRQAHPALTDDLTGLPNRLHFDVVFEVVFHLAGRGVPMTLARIGVDALDEYRARRGEEGASEAVGRLGNELGESVRGTDVCARVSDGAFALLLLDCNLQGGLTAVERILEMVAGWTDETSLTLGVGLASWTDGMRHPGELWELAGEALEAARARGGGQVELARRR